MLFFYFEQARPNPTFNEKSNMETEKEEDWAQSSQSAKSAAMFLSWKASLTVHSLAQIFSLCTTIYLFRIKLAYLIITATPSPV